MAKHRIPKDIKVIGFAVDNFDPQISEFNRIFEENGFLFTREAANAINKSVYFKENVRTVDGYHWNEAGQLVVANALVPIIRENLKTYKNE